MIDTNFISQYDSYISYCILLYCKQPIDDYKQDIYLKLIETPFRHECVKGYISKVVRNYFYDKFRTSERKRKNENISPLPITIPSDTHFIYKDTIETLRTLPGGKCLRLYAEGYKYIEIAEILHISLSSVKVSIHNVRLKLRCEKFAKKHNAEKQISEG